MADVQKYSITRELNKADEKYQGSLSLLGMTALTFPGYINSMRSTMFTSHLKQFLNLLHPDIPYIFTNAENLVGAHNSAYTKAKGNYEVIKKVVKYGNIIDNPNIYYLFVFNHDTKSYELIERKPSEDLTENFGYNYNNEVIDSYEEGDDIPKGTILSKSTSYDDYMNYGYGKNIVVMYTLDPFTSEDAAVASEWLHDNMTSIEYDTFMIALNSNDFLVNLFGDEYNYQPLPEIGQVVKGKVLAALKRQYNTQLLSDFKEDSLNHIGDDDLSYYVDANVEVVDYTFYDNNEEENESDFYTQINKYLKSQTKFYKQIYETCKEIIESGYSYSQDIDYMYKRSQEFIDKKKKWKEGDSASSNMYIQVSVRKIVGLEKGQKVTGRFGNKSVISEIRRNEDMPTTEDGRRVDLMLNLLGILNRTTSFPLDEIFINSCSYQIRKAMDTMITLLDKEKMFFDYIHTVGDVHYDELKEKYNNMSLKDQEEFIQDIIDNGIYINQPPMWEKEPIFYRIRNIKERFPWLKPDTVYINKWGRKIKMLNDYWIGEMYILKLKQSDRRGFSVRSTGAIDTKELPTRSYKSRSHLEQHSGTAIRFGEFETLNFSIGILPSDIALFHAMYRTSVKGRKDIVNIMFTDPDRDHAIQKIDNSYTSRVAEIFGVILKSLSIGIEMVDEDEDIYPLNNTELSLHTLNGQSYMCTDYQFYLIQKMDEIKNEILEVEPVITTEELTKRIEQEMRLRNYTMGPSFESGDELPKVSDLRR